MTSAVAEAQLPEASDGRAPTRPRLLLTGRPRIELGESTFSVPAKGFAMLAILAASAEGVRTRAELRTMLWNQEAEAQGGANLRQLVARVRAVEPAIGAPLLIADRETVRINADDLDVDFLVLKQCAHKPDYDALVRYVAAYRGTLLADITVDNATFDSWVYVERAWLEDWFSTAAGRLLEPGPRALPPGDALSLARRLLSHDPANEAAYRAAMRSYCAMGSLERARRMYEECTATVRAEADVEPGPETVALAVELGLVRGAAPPRPATAVSEQVPAQPVLPDADGGPRVAFFAPHDITGQRAVEALARLLIEDTAIGLSRFRSFTVIAPHSSMQVGSVSLETPAHQTISANFTVKSFIKPAGEEPKLVLRLTEAASGHIVWAGEFSISERNLTYAFTEVVSRIVTVLAHEIETVMLKRLRRMEDPGAYRLYLEGRDAMRATGLPAMRRARRHFTESLRIQKDYAPALAGISQTLKYEWLLRGTGDPDMLNEARRNAERAISADPQDASAHVCFGSSALYQRRFDECLERFQFAEQLRPNDADLLEDYADALAHCGEPDTAWPIMNRAIALNPLCPEGYWWTAASIDYQRKEYSACIDRIMKMTNPEGASRLLAAAYAQLGLKEEARRAAADVLESYPDFNVESWVGRVPNRRKEDSEHYAEGLKLAGL